VNAGIEGDKITRVYNIPPNWESMNIVNKSEKLTLFAPGRIYDYKGFDVIVKSISPVVKNNKNIKLIVAGDGPYLKELIRLINNLNLSKYVELIGKVSYNKVKELCFSSDIILSLSIHPEPFSRVPLEAMVAGKPIIATNVGGTPEAVEDGVNGILVPPNNPEKTAEAIIRLVEDKKLREEMGKNGRKIVNEKFNPDKLTDKTIKLYEEVIYNYKKEK